MKITIPGDTISKKNSQGAVLIGKYCQVIFSKQYKKYAKHAASYLRGVPKWKGSYPVIVETYFYRKTLRIFDFDNMQATVNDVLVKAGILEDDSMRHVIPAIRGKGWEKDKDNPRVEILIKEL